MSQTFHSPVRFTATATFDGHAAVESLSLNSGPTLNKVLKNSYSINFGSISSSEAATTTVSFSGAELAAAAFVIVSTPTTLHDEIVVRADVFDDNVVKVRANNTGGSSKSAPTATYDLMLLQFAQ